MRNTVVTAILGLGLAVFGFLAGVGVFALFFAPTPTAFAPITSADAAAWVQAAAATAAVLASAGIAVFIQKRDHRAAKRQSADVAVEIASYAQNVLRKVRDQLATRQKVYDVANGRTYFDKSVLNDVWNMLSGVSLQDVRDAVITRELITLRWTVRQFRENVEAAIQHYASLNSHEYSEFFRVLNEAATTAATAQARIEASAKKI